MRTNKTDGFTLIELLMVIAIIGILASVLIPTVGVVREKSKIAASRIQLNNYVNSIQLFKGEYNFYPFVNGNADTTLELYDDTGGSDEVSREFIETLSGRDTSDGSLVVRNGNRRSLRFAEFSESEYYLNDSDVLSRTILADRFNNPNIHVLIDGDGNGLITPVVTGTEPEVPVDPLRANVTIWVEPDIYGSPGYGLWE